MSDKFSRLLNPLRDLKDTLEDKLDNTHLQEAKVHLIHKKQQLGKLGNLFNAQHRHDEEHEKRCDEKRSRICASHRFESYFDTHEGHDVKWYVDGRDYCWAVSEALEKARETIYIADWWLSPELFLRRPPHHNREWRLDEVLKRRAEAGVKIYVIVYREVEAALSCNSAHTKHVLHALCPKGSPGHGNIRVMRHPDHNVLENAADMTFYWAHHEKFIVIDHTLGFIGGLDLCFGRWDTHTHALADAHPEDVAEEVWPGQDFNNNRIQDFKNVQDWQQNELSKAENGRMPWHDVAMGLTGACVYDMAEHFVLRWNFVKRDKYKRDARYDWLELRGRQGEDEDLVGVQRPTHPVGEYIVHPPAASETGVGSGPEKEKDSRTGTVRAQLVRSVADWSSGTLTEHSIQNAYCELIRGAQHYVYIENQFFITATGDEQAPVHNQIGAAMVDAVVRAAQEKRRFRIIVLIPAVPGFAGDLRDDAATGTRAIMDYQYKSICRGPHSIFEQIRTRGADPEQYIFFFNLRSYDRLAKTPALARFEAEAGVSYSELQRAEAEQVMGEGVHETTDGDIKSSVEAKKAKANAAETKQRAVDAGAGDEAGAGAGTGEAEGAGHPPVLPSVAKHAMAGEVPLTETAWEGAAADEVQNWIQEELYIHAKLLIVDDRVVVCGSSNLNDRSQLGSHDSELSIVLEDSRTLPSQMDGQPFEASYLAASLRRFLWREHLGLLPPQGLDAAGDPNALPPGPGYPPNDVHSDDDSWAFVEDPLSDALWDTWTSQATTNTTVFRHLFHADPDNNIKTFEDYDRYMPPKGVRPGHIFDQFIPPEDIRTKLAQVRGHLVWMPLNFLKDAQMAEAGLQVNQWTESVYA